MRSIDEQLAELKGEAFVRGIKERYEQRLKAEKLAMLEELDLQIDELYFPQTYPKYRKVRISK